MRALKRDELDAAVDRAMLRHAGPAYLDAYIKNRVRRAMTGRRSAQLWYEEQVRQSDEYRKYVADVMSRRNAGKSIDAATLSRPPITVDGIAAKII